MGGGDESQGLDASITIVPPPEVCVETVNWHLRGAAIQDFFLVKIDRNGKERCRFAITDPVHLSDDALAVAFDQYGNMVAAGRTGTVRASSQFTVLKTNRQCNLVWRASIPGTASGHGEVCLQAERTADFGTFEQKHDNS